MYVEELARERRPRISGWVWIILFLGIFITLVASWFWGLEVGIIFLLITLTLLTRVGVFRHYRRIFYVIIAPFLVTAVVAGLGLNWLLRSLATERLLEGTLLEFLASDPDFWARLMGLIVGGLVPLMILEAYVRFNLDAYTTFTGLTAGEARGTLIGLLLHTGRPYIIVEGGEEKRVRPPGVLRWMGPGLVIITPGHAVVFEQGGRLTRVEFAGVVRVDGYEMINKIIDLRPKSSVDMVENVFTRDGVPLNIQLKIFFEILRIKDQEKSLSNPYPVDKETIFKAAYVVGNWQLAVPFIAGDVLRDVVAEHNLDAIIQYGKDPDKHIFRQAIKDEVRKRVDNITLGYFGTNVTWVDIGEIEMPEDARERLLARWLAEQDAELAEKEKLAAIVRSEGQAESLSTIGLARAKAQRQMILAITDAFQRTPEANVPWTLVMLRFVEALENMAKDPSTKLLFPYSLPFEKLEAIKSALERESGERGALPPPQT